MQLWVPLVYPSWTHASAALTLLGCHAASLSTAEKGHVQYCGSVQILTCHIAVQPPKFEFYDPQSPIYTSPRFLPPAKIVDSKLADAIISHGAFLEECTVENAIVGLRSRIGKNAGIRVRLCQPLQICAAQRTPPPLPAPACIQ